MEIGQKPVIMYSLQKEKWVSEIIIHTYFEVLCLTSQHNHIYTAALNLWE